MDEFPDILGEKRVGRFDIEAEVNRLRRRVPEFQMIHADRNGYMLGPAELVKGQAFFVNAFELKPDTRVRKVPLVLSWSSQVESEVEGRSISIVLHEFSFALDKGSKSLDIEALELIFLANYRTFGAHGSTTHESTEARKLNVRVRLCDVVPCALNRFLLKSRLPRQNLAEVRR